jgi:WD40 repeat protein
VRLFNPADGALVKDLGTTSDVAFDVAFSPAGDKLAASAADRSIRVYDVASGTQERLIEDHADWVMSIAWSPDGSQLASASRDKTSKLFDAKTGDSLATYPGHGDSVFGVSFTADGKQIISAGADREIHVWNPGDGKKTAEIGGFGLDVYQLHLENGQIFTCSGDKTARQFAADSRKEVRKYSGHADWVYTLSYNAASNRLATGSYDGEVRIWNTEDGKLVTAYKAAPGYQPTVQASAASAR